jgi:hypothetical protein
LLHSITNPKDGISLAQQSYVYPIALCLHSFGYIIEPFGVLRVQQERTFAFTQAHGILPLTDN